MYARLFTVILLAAYLSGCKTFEPKPMIVEPGFRDYAIITYHPPFDAENINSQILVRLELNGSGLLSCVQGRSPRVHDVWWTQPDSQDENIWQNYSTDRVVISQEDLKTTLQKLVDMGCLKKKKQGDQRRIKTAEYVIIQLRIKKKAGFLMTDSPDALQLYRDLYSRFRR